ncbi:helix-turn-helix domain-containing protein [Plastoroseomonas hellenica]|uniref:helix-turn-helix domain-containing protein n=1 Tax=Plastoroseomonas hellenica TaxID=2687306 RepID=UPI001BA75740|nr:helix-turn-helix domain-containing protein [Plastoroseomonas hellenica]MBR0642722.1 helix-turn-helix domain-containing protein [Plastoroseomonas hellenica]
MSGNSPSISPESAKCAEAQPNKLIFTSQSVGWTSLLIDLMEGLGTCDPFETHATPDVTLVVATVGRHQIEVFRSERWHRAVYPVGAAGITPPQEVARLRWKSDRPDEHFRTAHVYVPAQTIAEAVEEFRSAGHASGPYPPSELIFADRAVAQVVAALLGAMHSGAPEIYAEQCARWLAAHLLLRHDSLPETHDDRSAGSIGDRRLARTIEFMSANLESPLTLAQLASEAGVSVHHFSRLFRQQTGLTPAGMLTSMRLVTARRLLRTSDLSVTEVARRCGYSRPSSFASAFRRHFGQAPVDVARE